MANELSTTQSVVASQHPGGTTRLRFHQKRPFIFPSRNNPFQFRLPVPSPFLSYVFSISHNHTHFSDRRHLICVSAKALLSHVPQGRRSPTSNPPHAESCPLVSENDFLFFKLQSWLVFKMFSGRKSTFWVLSSLEMSVSRGKTGPIKDSTHVSHRTGPFTRKSCQSINAVSPVAIEEAAKLSSN